MKLSVRKLRNYWLIGLILLVSYDINYLFIIINEFIFQLSIYKSIYLSYIKLL